MTAQSAHHPAHPKSFCCAVTVLKIIPTPFVSSRRDGSVRSEKSVRQNLTSAYGSTFRRTSIASSILITSSDGSVSWPIPMHPNSLKAQLQCICAQYGTPQFLQIMMAACTVTSQ